jgi:hypothetical protein
MPILVMSSNCVGTWKRNAMHHAKYYSGIEYISVADKTVPDIGLRFDIPL